MANNNKEAERAELHKTIWRIANDLRGSVDGWDFKTYVLGMLFHRFISENLTAYLNVQERKAGTPDFDYARISMRGAMSTKCLAPQVPEASAPPAAAGVQWRGSFQGQGHGRSRGSYC